VAEWIQKTGTSEATDLVIRGKTIPSTIVRILQNRGYDTDTKIEQYFAPSLSDLNDPELIPDMKQAVDRLAAAFHAKEKVLIHGDYDTDGITGCALLVRCLRTLGMQAEYYIPHRIEEGYGISVRAIDYAVERGCSLLITVDCGISAIAEIAHARTRAIDVIVTDHHEAHAVLPQACPLVNPKMPGSTYPFKELAGVGVAFKLMQALYRRLGISEKECNEHLDLVALGTVVDVVPLINENRVLAKYGMKRMSSSTKAGFQALMEETGLKGELTAYHLGFVIGPRINACGRLRDAQEVVDLFITPDRTQARTIAGKLSEDNKTRQELENIVYKEALVLADKENVGKDRVIVLGKPEWHEGVVGIVASRISELYYRPTILLNFKDTIAKGSARSINGFDITDALKQCSSVLTKFGGHSQAAGLELKTELVPRLRDMLNQHAEQFNVDLFQKSMHYDMDIDIHDITDDLLHFLKYFEPTGAGNPQPVFLSRNLEVVGVPRVIGSGHLKFALRSDKKVVDAIAYGQAQAILDIEIGKTRIDCLYSVSEDSFMGKRKVVLKIRDMKKVTG
jgi:single-stranded-DNA-specific exonuclease